MVCDGLSKSDTNIANKSMMPFLGKKMKSEIKKQNSIKIKCFFLLFPLGAKAVKTETIFSFCFLVSVSLKPIQH